MNQSSTHSRDWTVRAPFPARSWRNKWGCSILCALFLVSLSACNSKVDASAEAPPKVAVEPDLDANNFKVDHPDQFPLVAAVEHKATTALNVTGVVQPDINRAVPVISLPTGRVVEIKARLGDGR